MRISIRENVLIFLSDIHVHAFAQFRHLLRAETLRVRFLGVGVTTSIAVRFTMLLLLLIHIVHQLRYLNLLSVRRHGNGLNTLSISTLCQRARGTDIVFAIIFQQSFALQQTARFPRERGRISTIVRLAFAHQPFLSLREHAGKSNEKHYRHEYEHDRTHRESESEGSHEHRD